MRGKTIGLAVVGLAVLVLAGSLVLGMRGGGAVGEAGGAGPGESGPRVRVEVLNAAGLPGLARLGTERLREAGFDVVYYGNGRAFASDTSLVLDRAGNPGAAHEVSAAIGIPRVESRPDTTLFLEVTVVLGTDWVGAPSPAADSAAADTAEAGS